MKKTFKAICRNVGNIFWLIKPYWKYSKFYFILTLFFWIVPVPLTRILMVIFPAKIVELLDSGSRFSLILGVVILFQLAFMLIPVFEDFYIHFFKNRMNAKLDLLIKRNVYKKALGIDYEYIDNPDYYDKYTWTVDNHAEKSGAAFSLLNSFISAIVVIVSLVGIIASNSPIIVILCALSMVIRTYAYMRYNRVEIEEENEKVPVDRKLGYFHRLFYLRDYSADLKSTSLKKSVFVSYDKESENKVGIIKKFGIRFFGWSAFSDIVYRVNMAAVILIVAYNIYIGNIIGAASYVTVMLAVDKLDEYMFEIFDLIKEGNRLGLYGENIRRFYDVDSKIETSAGGSLAEPDKGAFAVDFDLVNFKYANSEFAIRNLDIHIKPGEKIAIVGENGAGKSTFVKLLLRLYDPQSGSIKVNGTELSEYNIESLRGRIGVVFQNTNIYSFTLKENLALYNKPDDDSLGEIISAVGLDKMLEKNSATVDSYMTKEFDENGIMFSGGEAQKVGLARVMTGDFGLLLLDEPSSALDPIAEYEMNRLILERCRRTTAIIIAHRLSTIRDTDRIYLISNGTVAESGTHAELMELGGKYCEMFTKQAENYIRQ